MCVFMASPPKDVTHSMRGSANRAVSPQRGVGGFEGVTIGDLVVWANYFVPSKDGGRSA